MTSPALHRSAITWSLSLMLLLVLAKASGVAAFVRGIDLVSPRWFGDDVVAGVGMLVVAFLGRRWLTAVVYWAVVALAIANVPVVRALGSSLTTGMFAAAGSPLTDSFVHYLTPTNAAIVCGLFAAAASLPRLVDRLPPRTSVGILVASVVLGVVAPITSRDTVTYGLHRNVLTTLVRTSLPRINANEASGEWRGSRVSARQVDLGGWRGAASGRNVVLVVLESTAARYLRPYGAATDPTPRLTAFAASGIRFERAYTVYPESIKGLWAMLCARAPAFDVSAEVQAAAPCDSLPAALGRRGYRTALFHSGRFGYLGMQEVVSSLGFAVREDAGAIGGAGQSSFGVDDDATVRRALAWIDSGGREQRFVLAYLPTSGHHPYATTSPGPFSEPGEFGAYLNALHEGDEAFGRLVDGLRTRGLDANTLFVIVGDHGEAFGQHVGNFGHTLALYDENVRVPLWFVLPGRENGAVTVPDVASTIDVMPTVLDLMGLAVPAEGDGVSLLSGPPRSALFQTDYSTGSLGLQDGCWKQIIDLASRRSELFDTCRDPDETSDRSLDQPVRVQADGDRLRAWAGATKRMARPQAP